MNDCDLCLAEFDKEYEADVISIFPCHQVQLLIENAKVTYFFKDECFHYYRISEKQTCPECGKEYDVLAYPCTKVNLGIFQTKSNHAL